MTQKLKLLFHTNLDNINNLNCELKTEKPYIEVNEIINILNHQYKKKRNNNLISQIFDIDISNCLLKHNGRIIYKSQKIPLINHQDVDILEFDVIFPIKGGFFKELLDGLLYFFDEIIFNPILWPIQAIFRLFELIFWKIPMYLIKLLIWSFRFMAWFILEVCSPQQLIDDFGNVISTLVLSIVFAIFDIIKYLVRKLVNTVGPTIFNGFWGWDQVQDSEFDRTQAAYFDPNKNRFTEKNYVNSDNKIPMSIIIGTVIFPPLGVFMEYGLSGWIQILISGFLTLCFYFPGLVYALICLYC
jgi:uncharacterized membrane protein YqaE (UPF0057 family)